MAPFSLMVMHLLRERAISSDSEKTGRRYAMISAL
jgi:hypothetical protein